MNPTTKDQAMAMAADARTPEEVERAMMALATLPTDPEVAAARTSLSRALDRATAGPGADDGRMADLVLNPGFDNN